MEKCCNYIIISKIGEIKCKYNKRFIATSSKKYRKLGVRAYPFDPSTREAEAGGSL